MAVLGDDTISDFYALFFALIGNSRPPLTLLSKALKSMDSKKRICNEGEAIDAFVLKLIGRVFLLINRKGDMRGRE